MNSVRAHFAVVVGLQDVDDAIVMSSCNFHELTLSKFEAMASGFVEQEVLGKVYVAVRVFVPDCTKS